MPGGLGGESGWASTASVLMKTLPWSVSTVSYPGFVRAPLRGFSCALRQLALLLRLRRPTGYGFPPNLVRKERRKDFSGASANAELRHLGAMAHSLNSAPIKIGKFNKRRQSCTRTK